MFPFEPWYLTAHHLYSPLLTAPPKMHSCSSELDQIMSPGPSYLPQVDTVGDAVVCYSCKLKVWIYSVVNIKSATLFNQVTNTVKSFCFSPGAVKKLRLSSDYAFYTQWQKTTKYVNSVLDINTVLGNNTLLYLSISIFWYFKLLLQCSSEDPTLPDNFSY